MIVDTSAIMAILNDEPGAAEITRCLASADRLSISAGTWIELGAVITRFGDEKIQVQADLILDGFGVAIVPVSLEQAGVAREGYRRYGRGTGHPAKLNFGDCFAYALAKATGEPLLFKGGDFAQTDVARALPA